jgi:hypothetical protein
MKATAIPTNCIASTLEPPLGQHTAPLRAAQIHAIAHAVIALIRPAPRRPNPSLLAFDDFAAADFQCPGLPPPIVAPGCGASRPPLQLPTRRYAIDLPHIAAANRDAVRYRLTKQQIGRLAETSPPVA